MPAVIPILIGASIGTQVYGQVKAGREAKKAGQAQREASESQAELADYNASVADLQAKDAVDRGAVEEQRFRQGVRGIIGSQRADIAANGVDVGFGSAVDVQADAAFLGEMDALQIRTNAAREAWGFGVQAEDLRKRGEIARKEGVYLEKAGNAAGNAQYISAAGTALSGTASLLQTRYGMKGGK